MIAARSITLQSRVRSCWHATETLQFLQSLKMAGPATGPITIVQFSQSSTCEHQDDNYES